MSKARIVILGGGFAGVKCARTLRKQLSVNQYEIVVFNRENHMVFHPMLAEVVGASLSPEDIAAPLRQMMPKVICRTEDAQRIDLEGHFIEYEGHDGQVARLNYEHLVIACGGVVNLGMMPGMSDHSFPMKTIGDAVALRAHIMQQLERAEVCDDPVKKRWYLSFIVVGGGYSGVEAAGEIFDLIIGSQRYFQNFTREDLSVTLIHSQNKLLPEIGEKLRDFVGKSMVKAGIKVVLKRRVKVATPEGVRLDNDEFIYGGTTVCTIGTAMSPVVERLKSHKHTGRVVTETDMSLPNYPNVWSIGDCAYIMNAYDNKPSPPTAQFAERQGRQVANNIVRRIKKDPTKPFYFKPLGQLCAIGGHKAVAEMFGIHISGVMAWFFWRGIYLSKIPSWSRRCKIAFNWAWQLVFSRDLSHLRVNQTERVSRAHYQQGDYVFHQGDPATNFYVIEKGEAEVTRLGFGEEQVVAVLTKGSFFGEMALINNQPRGANVRARTELEVVVIGRTIFSQISGALAPLQNLLTATVSKRSKDVFQNLPLVREILSQVPVSSFTETYLSPMLKKQHNFLQILQIFETKKVEFCYVSEDGYHLDGIITRAEIFGALETANSKATAAEIMIKDPITIKSTDSSIVAASTMRDKELSWLPVLSPDHEILGYVKIEAILSRALMNVSKTCKFV